MPLFIDDDQRSYDTFELSTASTLYWKAVPVLLRQADREDVTEVLTVRILSGVQKQNHSLRVLRLHLSSETDLFFLHTLEVTEEDFQNLKVEQGILVDFANFPGKIIGLLEKCIAARDVDSPRFQAVLTVRGAESVFKIVETNDFKQLPHIALSFRPGNDSSVKQFLAFRLLEVKGNCEDLNQQLQSSQEEQEATASTLDAAQQQLAALKEAHSKQGLEMQANARSLQAAAQEEKLREKAELKEHLEREMEELERRLQEQAAALSSRITELDTDNRKLRDQKYELDTRVSELSHKLGTSEGAKKSAEEEAGRLRGANQALSRERHEGDIQLNEARARLSALEEKVSSQSEVVVQQRARVKDLESAVQQWEARCAELRGAAAGAEQRAKESSAEVLKGNQIIEKLTNDVRTAKEKVKRKQAIIGRQEEELAQREQQLERATREGQAAAARCEHLQRELKAAGDEAGELRAKLDDSRQQLQSNEQMIRWLNQQVTEAQLQVTTTLPGSRYGAFKPSVSLPAAPAPHHSAPHLPSSSYTSRYTAPAPPSSTPMTPHTISPTAHHPMSRMHDPSTYSTTTSSLPTDGFTSSYARTARTYPPAPTSRPLSSTFNAPTPASVQS